jgi:hypothetical protein
MLQHAAAGARNSTRVSRRSLASRLDSGSSSRKSRGWRTMARRQRHALLLAAGQAARAGAAGRWPTAPRCASASCHARAHLGARHAGACCSPKADVLGHAQVREERVALEHHRRCRARCGGTPVTSRRRPAPCGRRCGLQQPGDRRACVVVLPQPEGPSSEHGGLARGDVQRGVGQRGGGVPVLADTLEQGDGSDVARGSGWWGTAGRSPRRGPGLLRQSRGVAGPHCCSSMPASRMSLPKRSDSPAG